LLIKQYAEQLKSKLPGPLQACTAVHANDTCSWSLLITLCVGCLLWLCGWNQSSASLVCFTNAQVSRATLLLLLLLLLLLQEHYCLALGVAGQGCGWLAEGLQLDQLRALGS
jgi:hypothetical protein